MEKNKIAEGIIIRVGGGIREVYREPLDPQDIVEPTPNNSADQKQEGRSQSLNAEIDTPSSLS